MAAQTLIKQPGESRLYSMDFSGLLAAGETLASVDSVVDSPVGVTFDGSPVASGVYAQQRISGGTSGIKYKVTMTVTTSAGNVLEGEGVLQVKDL